MPTYMERYVPLHRVIVLHHIVCFFHAALFVEEHGAFVCNQKDCDDLFSAGQLMSGFHQALADSLAGIIPVHSQIGDVEPIRVIRKAIQHAHQQPLFSPSSEADGNRIHQAGDPLLKAFFGVLGAKIGMLEKADAFLSIYQPVTCGNVPVRCISISSGPFAMLLIVPA